MENTELTLMNGILIIIKESCKNYRFLVPKSKEYHKLNYYEFDLPIKNDLNKDEEYYSFISIKPVQGEQVEDKNSIIFSIQIGIYDEIQQDGCRSVYNVINSIEKALRVKNLIGTGELNSLKWEVSNGITHPYHKGKITVEYNLPKIYKGGYDVY